MAIINQLLCLLAVGRVWERIVLVHQGTLLLLENNLNEYCIDIFLQAPELDNEMINWSNLQL